ncbi:hypothetical protein [Scytonema hofmannii]|nr:hypothetical protein [Scytonema hofmannii]
MSSFRCFQGDLGSPSLHYLINPPPEINPACDRNGNCSDRS